MPSFDQFYEGLVDAQFDWVADTIKAALLTSSWTPSRTLDFYSELTNELASGDGYTTGGLALTTKAVNTASNIIYLDADDLVWTFAATKAFQYLVVYKDTGVGATSRLIRYVDLGVVSVSGQYTIQLNALGLMRLWDGA